MAVVVAEDADRAEEALRHIDVEYEPLPVYDDPEAATAPGGMLIHAAIPQRDFVSYPDLILNTDAGPNIFNHFKLRKGDVDAGFAEADHIFEHTYRTPQQQHVSLEPHVAICEIRDGRATVWSSASSPFTARFQVAETLRLPQNRVRVITWHIGGAFGGKSVSAYRAAGRRDLLARRRSTGAAALQPDRRVLHHCSSCHRSSRCVPEYAATGR